MKKKLIAASLGLFPMIVTPVLASECYDNGKIYAKNEANKICKVVEPETIPPVGMDTTSSDCPDEVYDGCARFL